MKLQASMHAIRIDLRTFHLSVYNDTANECLVFYFFFYFFFGESLANMKCMFPSAIII